MGKGGLRLPVDSRSYLVFLLCCRLAPPPGRGSLRGALFPPSGLPLAPSAFPCGSPCGARAVGSGPPLAPPLCPPWRPPGVGISAGIIRFDWIASSSVLMAQAINWRSHFEHNFGVSCRAGWFHRKTGPTSRPHLQQYFKRK